MVDRNKILEDFEYVVRKSHGEGWDYVDGLTTEDGFKILQLLKEQEKPNGKCVNECECWDSAYERGKQDALKEQKSEYEKGFNDAMLRKQELMYEDTDGKWHKKDW